MSSTKRAKLEDTPPPIMSLPQELMTRVFSLIDIQSKMKLEQVCKMFRATSLLSSSWKGIDHLQLNLNCRGRSNGMSLLIMVLDLTCPGQLSSMNKQHIPQEKLSKVVGMMLQRTIIRKLDIHIGPIGPEELQDGCDQQLPLLSLELLGSMKKLFEQYQSQLRLHHLEIHLCTKNAFASQLVLWLLEHSTQTLRDLTLAFQVPFPFDQEQWSSYWVAIGQCSSLHNISIAIPNGSDPDQIVQALHGKELNKFSVCISIDRDDYFDEEPEQNTSIDFFYAICNSVGGDGLTSLSLGFMNSDGEQPIQLVDLSSSLKASESLKELAIDNGNSIIWANDYLPILPQLPNLFPNLSVLQFACSSMQTLDEDLVLNDAFFDACNSNHNTSLRVVFSNAAVLNIAPFRQSVTEFSETSGVVAEFEEVDEKSFNLFFVRENASLEFLNLSYYVDQDMPNDFAYEFVNQLIQFQNVNMENVEDEDEDESE